MQHDNYAGDNPNIGQRIAREYLRHHPHYNPRVMMILDRLANASDEALQYVANGLGDWEIKAGNSRSLNTVATVIDVQMLLHEIVQPTLEPIPANND